MNFNDPRQRWFKQILQRFSLKHSFHSNKVSLSKRSVKIYKFVLFNFTKSFNNVCFVVDYEIGQNPNLWPYLIPKCSCSFLLLDLLILTVHYGSLTLYQNKFIWWKLKAWLYFIDWIEFNFKPYLILEFQTKIIEKEKQWA